MQRSYALCVGLNRHRNIQVDSEDVAVINRRNFEVRITTASTSSSWTEMLCMYYLDLLCVKWVNLINSNPYNARNAYCTPDASIKLLPLLLRIVETMFRISAARFTVLIDLFCCSHFLKSNFSHYNKLWPPSHMFLPNSQFILILLYLSVLLR